MNGCLQCMCKEYMTVKFCKILAHKAKLSSKFVSTVNPQPIFSANENFTVNILVFVPNAHPKCVGLPWSITI